MSALAEPGELLALDSTEADIAEARRAADGVLARDCPSADRFAIVLVLSELLTNAARHAAGCWRMRLSARRGHVLAVEVHDDAAAMPRTREPDLVDGTGGLGLHLVRALAARIEVERDPRGHGKTVRALWILPTD